MTIDPERMHKIRMILAEGLLDKKRWSEVSESSRALIRQIIPEETYLVIKKRSSESSEPDIATFFYILGILHGSIMPF